METTQIPEVRESQKDHILCFHFSAPSILSCLLFLVPRCTNHPERLGCVRMFQLAWCRLHQYKWLNYFLINQMTIACGSHETMSIPEWAEKDFQTCCVWESPDDWVLQELVLSRWYLGVTSWKGVSEYLWTSKCFIFAPAFTSSPTTDWAAPLD